MVGRGRGWRVDDTGTVPARLVLSLGLVVVPLLVSCGEDIGGEGYSEANRDAFVGACTGTGIDDRLIRDVCECTWDAVVATVPYPDFVEIEEALRLDTLTPLPAAVTDRIADCFLEEAEL